MNLPSMTFITLFCTELKWLGTELQKFHVWCSLHVKHEQSRRNELLLYSSEESQFLSKFSQMFQSRNYVNIQPSWWEIRLNYLAFCYLNSSTKKWWSLTSIKLKFPFVHYKIVSKSSCMDWSIINFVWVQELNKHTTWIHRSYCAFDEIAALEVNN